MIYENKFFIPSTSMNSKVFINKSIDNVSISNNFQKKDYFMILGEYQNLIPEM